MNLYFLRHGIAVERSIADSENDAWRSLTGKGERRVRRIAQAMKALNLSFDIILSSPYRRAKQTAEIVAEVLRKSDKLKFLESLTPQGDSKCVIEHINRSSPAPASVLLVGHEPSLSELIARLVSDGTELSLTMKKGGLCKLSTTKLKHGRCATLEWLLTPKQMELMS